MSETRYAAEQTVLAVCLSLAGLGAAALILLRFPGSFLSRLVDGQINLAFEVGDDQ